MKSISKFQIVVSLYLFGALAACAHAGKAEEEVLLCLRTYREALVEGDLPQAMKLTVSVSSKIPVSALEEKTQSWMDRFKAGQSRIWIYPNSTTVIEDCALVVCGDHDEPTADDPAYLIKQGGEWKVLLGLTSWKRDIFELSEQQKSRFTELEEHLKKLKKEMRATPPGQLSVE